MASIKEVLDKLPVDQKRQIMHAFDQEWSFFIEYETGKIIGVNTDNDVRVEPEQQAGAWTLGRLK